MGLEDFDATDFEGSASSCCRRLEGFRNVEWRKGTPKQSSDDNSERDIVAKVQKARHYVPGHLIGHRVEVGVIAKLVRSSYKGAPAGLRGPLPAVDPHSGGQDADPAPPRRARGSLPRLV